MKKLPTFTLVLALASLGAVSQADAPTPAATAVVGSHSATWVASPNFGPRKPSGIPVDVVVLHSTCMSTDETAQTVQRFQSSESQVSSHYVVGKDGQVVQMVSEADRAWHAGVCKWQGRTDVNSCSIGIEMVHRDQDPGDTWPDAQIEAVARLLQDIRTRHRVPNDHVIFHSECAFPPGRKTDPVGFDRPRLLQRVMQLALASESPGGR
jgi:N-acetylmuramoyl-L-alanine amidase